MSKSGEADRIVMENRWRNIFDGSSNRSVQIIVPINRRTTARLQARAMVPRRFVAAALVLATNLFSLTLSLWEVLLSPCPHDNMNTIDYHNAPSSVPNFLTIR